MQGSRWVLSEGYKANSLFCPLRITRLAAQDPFPDLPAWALHGRSQAISGPEQTNRGFPNLDSPERNRRATEIKAYGRQRSFCGTFATQIVMARLVADRCPLTPSKRTLPRQTVTFESAREPVIRLSHRRMIGGKSHSDTR
jgi:hypothetical protein